MFSEELKKPLRMVISGNAGTQKTTIAVSFILEMKERFDKIHIFVNHNEVLYEYLKTIDDENKIEVYEDIESLKSLKENVSYKILFIFDDLELTKENKDIIEDLFMRRRTNVIYIENSYLFIPQSIRETSEYAIFTTIQSHRTKKEIENEFDVKDDEEYTYKLLKKNYLK